MIYAQLFYEFFKIGLFNFGGGTTAIPFLQDMSVNRLVHLGAAH